MKDLFGNDSLIDSNKKVPGKRKAENTHKQLLAVYGIKEGETCKNCIFRIRFSQGSKTWSKCKIGNPQMEGHIATDWRVAWQACGKFESKPEKKDGKI